MNDELLKGVPVQPLVELIQAYVGLFACLASHMGSPNADGRYPRLWMVSPLEVQRREPEMVSMHDGMRLLGYDNGLGPPATRKRKPDTTGVTDTSEQEIKSEGVSTGDVDGYDGPVYTYGIGLYGLKFIMPTHEVVRADMYRRGQAVLSLVRRMDHRVLDIAHDLLDIDLPQDGYDDACRKVLRAPMCRGGTSVTISIDVTTLEYFRRIQPVKDELWLARRVLTDIAQNRVAYTAGHTTSFYGDAWRYRTTEEVESAHPEAYRVAVRQLAYMREDSEDG